MDYKLSRVGNKALKAFQDFFKDHDFDEEVEWYHPKEWADKGESYCKTSELVVVYDGGILYSIINGEFGWELFEELQTILYSKGLWFEQGTSWYLGVYIQD